MKAASINSARWRRFLTLLFVNRRPGRGWALLLAMALGGAGARGATIRDDVPDSGYLALGSSPQYASVGTFVAGGAYTGSGVLIAPDWVLTAAHLMSFASSGTFTLNGVTYTSSQFIRDPGWNGNVLDGSDFGLVHLSTPVTSVTPALLYTGSAEFGQVGTFVGFGMTGTGLTGETTLDYQKRGFQNVIDGNFGNPSVLLGCDFDNPHSTADNYFGDAAPLPLEGCAGNGDSGGGVFITVGGQTYLAGIMSAVLATDGRANADYGDLTAFGRVSAFAPWIENYVPVPEPASTLLLTLGGLAVLGRRRNRIALRVRRCGGQVGFFSNSDKHE